MVSPIVRCYIVIRALQLKVKIPKQIGRKLSKYEKNASRNNNNVKFTCFQSMLNGTLEASSIIPKRITISPEWAVNLILFNDCEVENAFYLTVGHELTHKDGDFSKKCTVVRDKKFINWINEVHADFGAAKKMVDSNRNKLIDSMKYKLALKENDKDGPTHPSWKRRLEYVSNYSFDEKLIKQIANPLLAEFEPQ